MVSRLNDKLKSIETGDVPEPKNVSFISKPEAAKGEIKEGKKKQKKEKTGVDARSANVASAAPFVEDTVGKWSSFITFVFIVLIALITFYGLRVSKRRDELNSPSGGFWVGKCAEKGCAKEGYVRLV